MSSHARRSPDLDTCLGALLLFVGGASLVLGVGRTPNALAMTPAMDGCLVTGGVSLLLALAAGVSYARALALLSPLVLIQLLGCRVHHANPLAVLGLEALVAGGMGVLASAWRRGRGPGMTATQPARDST